MNREQFRNYKEFFAGEIEVTHGTMGISGVSLAGPLDLYQFQVDTFSTQETNSSLLFTAASVDVKRRAISGAGTSEFTLVGRRLRLTSGQHLYVSRPDGDTHTLFWTLIYKPIS